MWQANLAGEQDIAYAARFLAQVSLPYNEPKPDTNVWARRNGDLEFLLTPRYSLDGVNGDRGTPEFPFGAKPRLLLTYLSTQAVRTRSAVIKLGPSQNQFLAELGLGNSTGKAGPARLLRMQANRLLESKFLLRSTTATQDVGFQFQVASKWNLGWGKPDLEEKLGIPPGVVILSNDFFQYVTDNPVPVDWAIILLLKERPMALDFYVWLTHRYSWLKWPTTVPWVSLREQLGSDFARDAKGLRNFKGKAISALDEVLKVYPEAGATPTKDGLYIVPSLTSVPPKGMRALRATASA